jgi:hypothetical protein
MTKEPAPATFCFVVGCTPPAVFYNNNLCVLGFGREIYQKKRESLNLFQHILQTEREIIIGMSHSKMDIFVRVMSTGKVLTLSVSGATTVSDIKQQIQAHENVFPKYQRLQFCGTLLETDAAEFPN